MAKQNFLSGGFYGKLGAVVGQRWKNIRTMRVYVIPHDPKTPLQMVQRNKFKDAVVYAQAAMMSNYHSNFFESERLTEWNIRMSTARNAMKTSTDFLTILPLIPQDKVAPFKVSEVTIQKKPGSGKYVIRVNDAEIVGKRTCMLYATINPQTINLDEVFITQIENTEENPNIFTVEHADEEIFSNNPYIRMVSIDDTDSAVDMILSSQLQSSGSIIVDEQFDTSVFKTIISRDTIQIIFNQVGAASGASITVGAMQVSINGTVTTHTFPKVSFEPNTTYGNKFVLTLQNDLGDYLTEWEIPTNALLSISSVTAYNDAGDIRYIGTNTTATIDNIELNNPWIFEGTISSVSIGAQCIVINLAQKVPPSAVFSSSQNISVKVRYNSEMFDFITSEKTMSSITRQTDGTVQIVFDDIYSFDYFDCTQNIFTIAGLSYTAEGITVNSTEYTKTNQPLAQYGKYYSYINYEITPTVTYESNTLRVHFEENTTAFADLLGFTSSIDNCSVTLKIYNNGTAETKRLANKTLNLSATKISMDASTTTYIRNFSYNGEAGDCYIIGWWDSTEEVYTNKPLNEISVGLKNKAVFNTSIYKTIVSHDWIKVIFNQKGIENGASITVGPATVLIYQTETTHTFPKISFAPSADYDGRMVLTLRNNLGDWKIDWGFPTTNSITLSNITVYMSEGGSPFTEENLTTSLDPIEVFKPYVFKGDISSLSVGATMVVINLAQQIPAAAVLSSSHNISISVMRNGIMTQIINSSTTPYAIQRTSTGYVQILFKGDFSMYYDDWTQNSITIAGLSYEIFDITTENTEYTVTNQALTKYGKLWKVIGATGEFSAEVVDYHLDMFDFINGIDLSTESFYTELPDTATMHLVMYDENGNAHIYNDDAIMSFAGDPIEITYQENVDYESGTFEDNPGEYTLYYNWQDSERVYNTEPLNQVLFNLTN